jgi:hypothetical protein
LKKPDQLPKGLAWDEGLEKDYKAAAHKLGLSAKQAQGLLEFHLSNQAGAAEKSIMSMEEGSKALKEEWKEDYDKNLAIAVRAVDELAPPEVKVILDSTGLGNHPAMIKWMSEIGREFLETTIVGEGGVILSKEEALAKIAAIMGDAKHPYMNPDDPKHKEAMEEVSRLYATAYPR